MALGVAVSVVEFVFPLGSAEVVGVTVPVGSTLIGAGPMS